MLAELQRQLQEELFGKFYSITVIAAVSIVGVVQGSQSIPLNMVALGRTRQEERKAVR